MRLLHVSVFFLCVIVLNFHGHLYISNYSFHMVLFIYIVSSNYLIVRHEHELLGQMCERYKYVIIIITIIVY